MRRMLTTVLLGTVLAAGGWALCHRGQIGSFNDAVRLAGSQFGQVFQLPRGVAGEQNPAQLSGWSRPAAPDRIRVATFNIQTLGNSKAAQPEVMMQIAAIIGQFDLVAIQEIRNQNQTVLPELVGLLRNSTGRAWEFVVSPPQGRSDHYREQSAFVFDRQKVTLDESGAYPVQDPEGLLIRPPYVGWFRAVGPPPEMALTFSLVNLHLDASRPEAELGFLQQLYRAVRNDGRGEDDVILLGDFNAGDRLLDASTRRSQLVRVVTGRYTNTRGTCQYDNILFDGQATVEYLGSGGVFDFLRHFNLSLEQALAISDHLPVWAELSVVEGGVVSVPRSAAVDSGTSAGHR